MKKRFNLLYLLLIVLLLVPVKAFAAGSITTSVNSVNVEVGETATFNIVSDNAYGFWKITSGDATIATIDPATGDTGTESAGKVLEFPVKVKGIKVGKTTITIVTTAATVDTTPVKIDGTLTVTVNVVEKVTEYTVTFNTNGGSAVSSMKATSGNSITLPTPTKAGHTFGGWYEDSALTKAVSGTTYKPTADVTLYAKWTASSVKSYTVTFNANGGKGAPSTQTKEENKELVLSTTKPTKEKYEFIGWNTKKDGTGTNYQPGGKYTANSDVTLYAQWKETQNVDKNPNTGDSAIFIILAIALTLGGYSYWYTKKSKES